MTHILTEQTSLVNDLLRQLRDHGFQEDRATFRDNMECLGFLLGYEISKTLEYREVKTQTSLGIHRGKSLQQEVVVLSVLRAGIPLHMGMLRAFPRADSGFVGAMRKHNSKGFTIDLSYSAYPDLNEKVIILGDPMIASGASIIKILNELSGRVDTSNVHLAACIASSEGIDAILQKYPAVNIWVGDVDTELNKDAYIVPGLGDAGDLAFGPKTQH